MKIKNFHRYKTGNFALREFKFKNYIDLEKFMKIRNFQCPRFTVEKFKKNLSPRKLRKNLKKN